MDERRRRRLAAILMADIAGFSRMMGRDDEGTTARVIRFHDQAETLASTHGGRVVDTAGDSVFAVFESIVAALECATALQEWLAKDTDPDRIMIRIGLHLGDVLVEDERFFGDGVNVAARLQELAPVGGIAASEVVFHEVGTRLPFRPMGTRRLKNIARPMKVYAVAPDVFGFAASAQPSAGTDADDIRDAAEDVAGLIRDRIAEKRVRGSHRIVLPEPHSPTEPRHPRTVSGVLAAAGFWLQAALGVLLVAAYVTGWTENGAYPFAGSIFLGGAAGTLLRVATRRRGVGTVVGAIGIAVGATFLSGTVTRAMFWVLAAVIGGPALVRSIRAEKVSSADELP